MSVLETIRLRRSVRKYRSDPVPDDALGRVLEAARLAPSAKNIQPWKFIVVRDERKRLDLAKAAHNQKYLGEAPIVIAACGIPGIAYPRQAGFMNSWPIDVTIAFEHLILQAAEEGLGTCWIGAFDEPAARAVLRVPEGVRVMALTPLGWPAESPPARDRKAMAEIVSYEKF